MAYNFTSAISHAEKILSEKGFSKPTEDLPNWREFDLNYQPVKVMPGFYSKKIERATESGEKVTFEIYVKKLGDQTFVEIFQRISNTIIK